VEFSARTVETGEIGADSREIDGASAALARKHQPKSMLTMREATSIEQQEQADGSLEIRVLGELTVLRNGKRIELPPSRKTRALLAYLAVVDRSQQRERLCRMFWDLPDDPRGSLRWSLSKIRQIMNSAGQDCLVTDRNSVALQTQSIVIDLHRIKAISMHDIAALATSELEGAAGLLRGGFLEDLSLPRCPDFEAWRASHIDEVDLLKTRILRALINRVSSEPSRALPYAHALHALHPSDAALADVVKTLAERARDEAVSKPLPAERVDPTPRELSPPPSMSDRPTAADVPSSDPDAERKHVTVLAIEIVSPLHAFASMDPGLVSQQMDPLLESTIAIVEQHGGLISGSGDTGVTAVFGALPMGGHHAVAACQAALSVKSTVERQSGESVRVRAGLDTGEVIVRRRRGATERIEVTGAAVRSAARLARALRRGALAATDRTHAAVAGVIGMARLPRADFPGFDRDQQAYELQSAGPG
jgi:DNA-binding SARP family transcriptional activator/class 3 adenylate cyclase